MSAQYAKAKAQCPVYKNGGKCPFATEEVKQLLAKFRNLPGYGEKKCPHSDEASIGGMNKDKFDAIVKALLATPEGAAVADDLKKFQAICDAVFGTCPHAL